MDYDLTRLGTDGFEGMSRALFHKQLGPTVSHFGDGPDGGREATFTGKIEGLPGADGLEWDGFVVLQAKFLARSTGTSRDQAWLMGQLRKELKDWADPNKKRRKEGKVPDYLVLCTNVVLSPATGGGVDTVTAALEELAPAAGIRGWLIWHRDQIGSMLDDAQEIRRCYRGFITTGDVLSKLMDELESQAASIIDTLRVHAAQSLVQDRFVRLTEAGGTNRLTLEQVAVDLPLLRPAGTPASQTGLAVAELVAIGDHVLMHDRNPSQPSKVVLIGGPGQGKSTLTNLLAQVYRVAILREEPARHGPLVASVITDTLEMLRDQRIPVPRNRRWPVRINLATLAEEDPGQPGGLLRRIAATITASTGHVGRYDLRAWLHQYPWLLILDGYDEVASATARKWIQHELVDLFILADTLTSDLMTVITTRPQGYEDDFAGTGAEHVWLKPLVPAEAFTFAERFAKQHFGQDVTERQSVLRRVRAATEDARTSRLMVSPLQVTIMTLLLEGRERAPRGRYRLFDEYFDTIYRREMNKPGPVGELLEVHRRDIEQVHEQVALHLQVAAENAEASDAVLDRATLHELALARLSSQGHDGTTAARLATTVVDIATTRLVLLVPKKQGVGFEVRSLQEYMAARAITQGPDDEILARLAGAGPSAHWRNVWLLAVARSLDVKEHLRGGVLGLLSELSSDPIARRTGMASELAGELLADSVGMDTPSFRQQLLDVTLAALDLPPRPFDTAPVLDTLAAEKPIYRSSIVEALQRALHGRADTTATAWIILNDLQQGRGPLAATATRLLDEVTIDPAQLEAVQAWRDASGRAVAQAKTRLAALSSFLHEDPAAYLDDASDLEQLTSWTTLFGQRKVRVLRREPSVVLPEGRSMLTGGIDEPPPPTSLDVREALAIAIDTIDPTSWAASSAIRSSLWRSVRRDPTGNRLTGT